MSIPKRPEETASDFKTINLIDVINDCLKRPICTISGKYIKEKFFLHTQEHVSNDDIQQALFLFVLSGWDISKNVDKIDIESFEYSCTPRNNYRTV